MGRTQDFFILHRCSAAGPRIASSSANRAQPAAYLDAKAWRAVFALVAVIRPAGRPLRTDDAPGLLGNACRDRRHRRTAGAAAGEAAGTCARPGGEGGGCREIVNWRVQLRDQAEITILSPNPRLRVDLLDETGAFLDAKPYLSAAYGERSPLMHEVRADGVDL